MSIKPEAFIAIEETMAHTVGLSWYEAVAPYIEEIIDLIGKRQWSQAHMLIDGIRFDAVVDGSREAVEELSVTALLFGAHHVTGEVATTSFATGKQPLPAGLTQAIDHLSAISERNSAEVVRNQLHKVIAELEEEEKLVALGKEDMSQDDLDVAGRANPEQGGTQQKTLYVHRKLINSAEIIAWAKEQGFRSTLEQDDLHVTVCFSREPLEWPAEGSHDPEVRVLGDIRRIEQFGKATVLTFDSPELQSDHLDFRDAGASFDFPDYRPHLTLTYDASGIDLDEVEPYEGELIFGPEHFSEIKEDWSDGIKEHVLKADRQSLAQMLNAAVMDGKKMVDIGANLTTSRLIALGFLAEAADSEIATYQVNEVLDDVTCDVCRFMHGKTFNVGQQYSRLMTVLATSDPSELKSLSPWPKNTKAGMEELRGMTDGEMQAAGYGSPPYHPGCRGFLVMVGTVTEQTHMRDVEFTVPQEAFWMHPSDVKEHFQELQGTLDFSALTNEDVSIVDNYVGNAYRNMNQLLRNPKHRMEDDLKAFVQGNIAQMDAALNNAPALPNRVMLYRGVEDYAKVFGVDDLNKLQGRTILDRGFLSVTGDLEIAKGFGEVFGAVFEIEVPAGMKTIIPEAVAGVMTGPESELILPRGLRLKVTRVDTERSPPRISATIIGALKKAEPDIEMRGAGENRFMWG